MQHPYWHLKKQASLGWNKHTESLLHSTIEQKLVFSQNYSRGFVECYVGAEELHKTDNFL